MAAPLLRTAPLLRLRLQHHRRLTVAASLVARRPCSTATELTRPDENSSSAAQNTSSVVGCSSKAQPSYPRVDGPDFKRWKDKEEEILEDIQPIALFVKDILHSPRYMDGETLTIEDEKFVVEKLLAFHPHSEDKIGCGLDSIMKKTRGCKILCQDQGHQFAVWIPDALNLDFAIHLADTIIENAIQLRTLMQVDRHPQFGQSRCLFVIRTDGGWIDFSYQKCLRAYIRQKYPSYAEKFIQEHYKRSS